MDMLNYFGLLFFKQRSPSNTGVVFTVEDIASNLFGKLKKNDLAKVIEALKDKEFKIEDVKDSNDLVAWVVSFANELVEDDYIQSEKLEPVFDIITSALGINLPNYSFDYWNASRINGWEVPTETPCIVFTDSDLFETKMTAKGKKLAALLKMKSISQTIWTVMSV